MPAARLLLKQAYQMWALEARRTRSSNHTASPEGPEHRASEPSLDDPSQAQPSLHTGTSSQGWPDPGWEPPGDGQPPAGEQQANRNPIGLGSLRAAAAEARPTPSTLLPPALYLNSDAFARKGAETVARSSITAQLGQPALLLFPKQAADGRLDALALGALVQGVLAAAAAAGVAALLLHGTEGGTGGRRAPLTCSGGWGQTSEELQAGRAGGEGAIRAGDKGEGVSEK